MSATCPISPFASKGPFKCQHGVFGLGSPATPSDPRGLLNQAAALASPLSQAYPTDCAVPPLFPPLFPFGPGSRVFQASAAPFPPPFGFPHWPLAPLQPFFPGTPLWNLRFSPLSLPSLFSLPGLGWPFHLYSFRLGACTQLYDSSLNSDTSLPLLGWMDGWMDGWLKAQALLES